MPLACVAERASTQADDAPPDVELLACRAWADQMLAAMREAAGTGVVLRWAEDDELLRLLRREGVFAVALPTGGVLAAAQVHGRHVWLADSALCRGDLRELWALLEAARLCAVAA